MITDKKPVLFFGGTFNPPHYGHTNLIQYVLSQMEFSRIYIVPSYHPPHKPESGSASFQDRLEMTRIMFCNPDLPPNVEISDMEKNLETPSYSWRTLDYLHKLHPGIKIYMLIGMDMYINLRLWENYNELVKQNSFIILKRENMPIPEISTGDILLNNPHWNISSIEIREIIANSVLSENGKKLDGSLQSRLEKLISPDLLQYILEHRVYR